MPGPPLRVKGGSVKKYPLPKDQAKGKLDISDVARANTYIKRLKEVKKPSTKQKAALKTYIKRKISYTERLHPKHRAGPGKPRTTTTTTTKPKSGTYYKPTHLSARAGVTDPKQAISIATNAQSRAEEERMRLGTNYKKHGQK